MSNLAELHRRKVNGVAFDPPDLAVELVAYGEPDAADFLLSMSEDTHTRVSVLALRKLISQRLTVDKAICLAAVEIHEGSPRELKRKRRVYPKK